MYYWKNKNPATKDLYLSLISFIREKKHFSIKTLENHLGYNREKSFVANKLTEQEAKNISNKAYYYLSRFLKEGIIEKTNKIELQQGAKPLIIYKVITNKYLLKNCI